MTFECEPSVGDAKRPACPSADAAGVVKQASLHFLGRQTLEFSTQFVVRSKEDVIDTYAGEGAAFDIVQCV